MSYLELINEQSTHERFSGGSHPLEAALVAVTKWALVGSSLALPLLAVPSGFMTNNRLIVVTSHLTLLVFSAALLAMKLGPLLSAPWFGERRHALLWSAVSLVALVTGYIALVTLATSAGLRYEPSLQFLQLLSALDVAWTASALGLGVLLLSGYRRSGLLAALVLDVICVLSIWNYLRVVGFDAAGGWLVSGRDLLTLVIPFDLAAATISVGALVAGARRRMAQDSGAA